MTNAMQTIRRHQDVLAAMADNHAQAIRAQAVAEVTSGIASPEYRRATLTLRSVRAVIKCCQFEIDFAREQLARACDPWFQP